ncbi:MAG: hypothetical protein ABW318_07870 [Vicinamibacterales bacterium]
MSRDSIKTYLLSLPERLLRSGLGLGAGVAREIGEVVLPDGVRRTRLYQNLVDTTLRFLIEQVGGVEGTYPNETPLPDDFLKRRTAGNVIEALGIVAFRASPVWVLAALADVCGMGRQLIPEIAASLKEQNLLDKDTQFASVDQILDGLESTSSRLAESINTPPLDVPTLRQEWHALREEARNLAPSALPSRDTITSLWTQLQAEAARQQRSVFETSSMLAVSAVKGLPDNARWLSASALVGASKTGQIVAGALLDHYRATLDDIRQTGFATYAARQLGPYVRAAVGHFSPERITLTERFLERSLDVARDKSTKGQSS